MYYTASDQPAAFPHLPAGEYSVTIVEACESVSRTTGADMIKLTLEAAGPGATACKVFDYLVASPSSAWKIDSFRRALGHEIVLGEAVELAAESLVGLTLRARLKVEEFNGRPHNKVEAWLPLAPPAAPPAAPAEASPAPAHTTPCAQPSATVSPAATHSPPTAHGGGLAAPDADSPDEIPF